MKVLYSLCKTKFIVQWSQVQYFWNRIWDMSVHWNPVIFGTSQLSYKYTAYCSLEIIKNSILCEPKFKIRWNVFIFRAKFYTQTKEWRCECQPSVGIECIPLEAIHYSLKQKLLQNQSLTAFFKLFLDYRFYQ